MAKNDPSVRTLRGGAPEYPEGTHPPHPPSQQTWGPYRFSYSDMPEQDKPDESTVAQVLTSDPLRDDVDRARTADAKSAQKASESR
jgi:hypothetical protein